MIEGSVGRADSRQWDSILFFAAGSLMLVNVAALWIRYYSNFQVSIAWAAIPGVAALTASIIALLKLYPRISFEAPKLARSGAVFAIASGAALCAAAIWIFGLSIFSGGFSGPPAGVLALIGVFIVSMVVAFICYAVAFLWSSSKNIGYLLTVPVASWGLMLIVGIIKGLEVGLTLDLYTNGLIAVAFVVIGFLLQKKEG